MVKPDSLSVVPALSPEFREILTAEALGFVGSLVRRFAPTRDDLLRRRMERQQAIDRDPTLDFLPETQAIRSADWCVAPIPQDLQDRRVEITGPVDRKMVINALNSGANCFMADFEDSTSPTWSNLIDGQINLRDAIEGSIRFCSPQGKEYALNDRTATLLVRPRGWHLLEKNLLLDGKPVPAGIVDFGLFFFHNARKLLDRGSGPYFYLPKLQSHLEARLWNEIFCKAQDELQIPRGSIRATVLIETLPAAFEMDEILYELRDHSAGLNCGRWDYIFSIIKTFWNNPDFTLPDRSSVTMTSRCMRAYSRLAIQTCHRRGIHAIGGMAAQIPIKNDPAANEQALAKVREDKIREAGDGHDGTWVAHPGLVAIAKEAFDRRMPGPNQIAKKLEDLTVTADDLLAVPAGRITEQGVRHNIDVGVQYLAAWLRGSGCVPIYNLMEDAATSEISRSQLWQWLHHPDVVLDNDKPITPELIRSLVEEEMAKLAGSLGEETFASGKYQLARELIEKIVTRESFTEFMTIEGYEHLN